MNWYKKSQTQENLGYKIVGYDPSRKFAFSIYDNNAKIDITLGKETVYAEGTFLGNTRNFCLNYYGGGLDERYKELLLTYSYKDEDLLSGKPDGLESDTELRVKKVKLIKIEELVVDQGIVVNIKPFEVY